MLNHTLWEVCVFSIDEHLCCFLILAIVNIATVNIGVHISFWFSNLVSLEKYPEVELLSCMVVLVLVFWGKSIPFFISGSASLNFHQQCTRVLFSTSSVQFSRSVVSDSLQPHEPQHARPPCPSPTPRVYPHSGPSSQWCHPTVSSSVIPFSSHLQSFPASGSFQMSQFFAAGGQSIGVSTSASALPMNVQNWFPLGWTGRISLQSKGLSRVFFNTTVQKHQFFGAQLSL